jgi:hypothetical protein
VIIVQSAIGRSRSQSAKDALRETVAIAQSKEAWGSADANLTKEG